MFHFWNKRGRIARASNAAVQLMEALEPRVLLSAVSHNAALGGAPALPTVTVTASVKTLSEAKPTSATFTVKRTGSTKDALTVSYNLGGTATVGQDYTAANSLTIPAGKSSATFKVTVLNDNVSEDTETITLTLSTSQTQVAGTPSSATISILDDDYAAADYFPTTPGARWDGILGAKGGANAVVGMVDAGGGAVYWVLGATLNPNSPDNEVDTLITDQNGIEQTVRQHPDGDTNTFTTPLLLVPAMMHKADVFTDSALNSADGSTRSRTITVAGIEKVTVPGGTLDCLKLTEVTTSNMYPGREVWTMWLGRGVGIVKFQVQNTGAATVNWQMATYSITSQWQAGPSLMEARDQFAAAVVNGDIYAFGGNTNPTGWNINTLEILPSGGQSWTAGTADANAYVEELTAATFSGKVYVFGAWGSRDQNTNSAVINVVEEYDPQTGLWTSKASKPTTVSGGTCAVYGDEIYVFGGSLAGRGDPRPAYDGVEAYDPATNTWRYVTKIPQKVQGGTVAVVGDTAYVLGGAVMSAKKAMAAPMAYNFVTKTWTTKGLAALPTAGARIMPYSSAAPVYDGKIYLVGGWQYPSPQLGWETNRVDIYDTASNTWSVGPSLPAPIANHAAVITNDTLYVIGGNRYPTDEQENALTDVLALPLT